MQSTALQEEVLKPTNISLSAFIFGYTRERLQIRNRRRLYANFDFNNLHLS